MKVKMISDLIDKDENGKSYVKAYKDSVIEVSDEYAAELIESKDAEAVKIDKSVKAVEVVEVEVEIESKLAKAIKNATVAPVREAIEVKDVKISDQTRLINTMKLAKAMGTGKWDAETKANAGQNETTSADGGVLVSSMIVDGIYANAIETSVLLGKCSQKPVGTGYNQMTIRQLNETNAGAADYNGVALNVVSEGGAITPDKLAYTSKTYNVNKLVAIIPFTSEILEDVPGMLPFTQEQVGKAYGICIDGEILYATKSLLTASVGGAGSRAVTLADASAPTLDELRQMYMAQIDAGRAEWYMSGAVYQNLLALESTLGQPVIFPNYTVSPFGTLFGRPVTIVNAMKGANGEAGTIGFCNVGEGYVIGTKGGVKMARSVELYYLTDQEAYRWILRIAGGPTKAVVATLDDGRTVSPMVWGHDA